MKKILYKLKNLISEYPVILADDRVFTKWFVATFNIKKKRTIVAIIRVARNNISDS